MTPHFQLLLFSTDAAYVQAAISAGVDSIIIDWENIGKTQRQVNADTQINRDNADDLRRIRAVTQAHIVCRINHAASQMQYEVEQAVVLGADEILLPMVQTGEEVERLLTLVNNRTAVSIMLETEAAVQRAAELAQFPLARVFVGLNDLAIERGSPSIFENVLNGTVEYLREQFAHIPFGFGGATLPTRGDPIPCRLLIAEMMRLKTDFTFLRRSFLRDVSPQDLHWAVPAIRAALSEASRRTPEQIAADHAALVERIILLRTPFR